MNDCIFCKIVNGEIPCYKVYEDADFLAFLDITQTTKGHTLVIPKEHVRNILSCDERIVAKTHELVAKLAKEICEKLGANGVNILNNNEEVAGQSVFHYHVHIIPRYDDTDTITIKFQESKVNIDEVYEILK